MLRQLVIANLAYLALVLQPTAAAFWPGQSTQPWLPGIVLVVSVMFCHESACLVWACLLGLGVDCLSIHRLGTHATVATILACGTMITVPDRRPGGMLIYGFYTFIVTFLWLFLAAAIHAKLESQSMDFSALAFIASTRAVSTMLLVEVAMIVHCIGKFTTRPREPESVVLANRWTMLSCK